jgi:ubiquinone/menaquinone biosynthesis C-methylase UbiE
MGLWDLKAERYDGWRRLPALRWILEREKRNLRMLIDSASDCHGIRVDAGTGAGSTLDVFPRSGRIIGMDLSLSMIRMAASKRPMTGVVGDIRRLPFRGRSIDFLSVIGVLEYLPDFHAFLIEAADSLAEKGYLLVTISEPGPLNSLRRLLGHPLYPIHARAWETSLKSLPFRRIQRTKSLMQTQFLYRKETEPQCAR